MDNITRLLGNALYDSGNLDSHYDGYSVEHEGIDEDKYPHQLLMQAQQIISSEAEFSYTLQAMNQPQTNTLTADSKAALEEEIQRRTAQLKDEFLNTVSHELRTPLSTIKMAIQVLERVLRFPQEGDEQGNSQDSPLDNSQGNSRVKQCLAILKEECDREINLINDLLALQQLEAELHPLLPTAILVQAWLPEIVDSFEETAGRQQQTLEVNIPDDLPLLISEISMFIAILRELLTNACKFSPPGATITITACAVRSQPPSTDPFSSALTHSFDSIKPAQKIQITVTNSGIEIAEANLLRVFDKFYRVRSDRYKQGGTGLGLALLKKRVEYLGGMVWVESNKGETRFTIELPNLMDVNP